MQGDLFTARADRDGVLDGFEISRAEYLAAARAHADDLARERVRVTINDVRERCPVPADIDPRVLGAVLRAPRWRAVGFVQSGRRTCHGRPIRIFERVWDTPS